MIHLQRWMVAHRPQLLLLRFNNGSSLCWAGVQKREEQGHSRGCWGTQDTPRDSAECWWIGDVSWCLPYSQWLRWVAGAGGDFCMWLLPVAEGLIRFYEERCKGSSSYPWTLPNFQEEVKSITDHHTIFFIHCPWTIDNCGCSNSLNIHLFKQELGKVKTNDIAVEGKFVQKVTHLVFSNKILAENLNRWWFWL